MTGYIVDITLLAEMLTREFLVPPSMQIGELAQLSAKAFSVLTESRYYPNARPVLALAKTGQTLNPNLVIQETEIRNGAQLLLY